MQIVNTEKVEPTPNTTGKCPSCDQEVFSRCGEVNVWHWAHRKGESCDPWYEPESEWHKNWKLAFGKDNCEIVITKENVRHIADIRINENVIIELQNSSIQKQVIRKREDFYGERMMWVVNGKHFKDSFIISAYSIQQSVRDDIDFYLLNDPLSKTFGKTQRRTEDELYFSWIRARRSWDDVQRTVFIDFGDENLLKIITGMGTRGGKCKKILKETFLKKYGGDLALLPTLIDDTSDFESSPGISGS